MRLAALALACVACRAVQHSDEPVTAQRPTIAADTSTVPAQHLEVEFGATIDPGDALELPVLLKYGLDPQTELYFGGAPYREIEDERGFGDLVVGARRRWFEEEHERPSVATQATLKLPTANEDRGLGSGEIDAAFALMATKHAREFAFTSYYELDLLGQGDGVDVGHAAALLAATPFHGRLSGFGEIAGVWVPDQDDTQGLLTLGMTFNPDGLLVYDAGIVLGMTDDAPDFQIVLGVTENFGHLFAR